MRITHIFFDLHGTLVDSVRLAACYRVRLGRVMAARYGGDPATWAEANRLILEDWDSYYADLNLSENFADLWEGYLRTTRALFRLTDVPEPELAEVAALSRELPGLATQDCNAFYADCPPVIERLDTAGLVLGICTRSLVTQARSTLQGAGVLHCFKGPIIGPDITERFDKDAHFFAVAMRAAQAQPQRCLVVDDSADALAYARAAGMRTVQMCRSARKVDADRHVIENLYGLLNFLELDDDRG